MKISLLICAVLLLAAFGLQATTVDPACMTASLATYDAAGFTCTIGDKTFSDFVFASNAAGGATTPITDSEITVVPIGGPPDWSFAFAAVPLAASPGQTNSVSLFYDKAVNSPTQELIDSAALTFTGSAIPGAAAGSAETLCLGSTYTSCTSSIFLQANTTTPTATATFTPVHVLSVIQGVTSAGSLALRPLMSG